MRMNEGKTLWSSCTQRCKLRFNDGIVNEIDRRSLVWTVCWITNIFILKQSCVNVPLKGLFRKKKYFFYRKTWTLPISWYPTIVKSMQKFPPFQLRPHSKLWADLLLNKINSFNSLPFAENLRETLFRGFCPLQPDWRVVRSLGDTFCSRISTRRRKQQN